MKSQIPRPEVRPVWATLTQPVPVPSPEFRTAAGTCCLPPITRANTQKEDARRKRRGPCEHPEDARAVTSRPKSAPELGALTPAAARAGGDGRPHGAFVSTAHWWMPDIQTPVASHLPPARSPWSSLRLGLGLGLACSWVNPALNPSFLGLTAAGRSPVSWGKTRGAAAPLERHPVWTSP